MNQDEAWGTAGTIEDVSGQVAIVGVGDAIYQRASGKNGLELAIEATERALADSGLAPGDIDGIMVTPYMGAQLDADAYRAHFGTEQEIWMSNKGGAMTWAATAPAVAAAAIREGKASAILNLFAVDWFSQKGSDSDEGPGKFHGQERMKANFELPHGWFPQPVYFATIARRHMWQYGTREEDLGALAVTCRRHANGHPDAITRDRTLSLDEYLARPMMVDPLRMEDCCLISDGGGAYIMTSVERARDLAKPLVVVEGVSDGYSNSGAYWSQQGNFTASPQVYSAPKAFEMAGLVPSDVDVLTLYDPFSIVALMQIEDMGFCEKGGASEFVAGTNLQYDSPGLAYNTHGGLLSHAYVLGISHVNEIVRQLRGEAANQVSDANVGVYGGYTGHMASTLILKSGS
ncbi:MAG TPA: thiolase family protein [Myxococcales bacterium]|nr:thiolase family protein [Myxococcales bacterium]HIM03221.1 thiolase family protein [Myxococcales bacterium]